MLVAIRTELIAHAEPGKLPQMQRFFKEPIDAYCTYTADVRNIAKLHGGTFGGWTAEERLELTAALWASGKYEEGSAAIMLYARMLRRCGPAEWDLLAGWLDRYVKNWAHCDGLCTDVLGPLLQRMPERAGELREWTASPAVYRRRGALVTPIKGIRKGLFREAGTELAELLAGDREPIIRIAVVWLRTELAGRR
jgi:3-methyladenine DNA glycosylase AlkD